MSGQMVGVGMNDGPCLRVRAIALSAPGETSITQLRRLPYPCLSPDPNPYKYLSKGRAPSRSSAQHPIQPCGEAKTRVNLMQMYKYEEARVSWFFFLTRGRVSSDLVVGFVFCQSSDTNTAG